MARRSAARFPALLALAMTTGCVTQPEIYAPPPQRKPLGPEILVRVPLMLDMSNPQVERAIVSDVARGPQSAPWRWTGPRPTVKVTVRSILDLHYHVELAIPEVAFRETGPVTIRFFINDRFLDQVKYNSQGTKVFDEPAPAGMLRPMSENTLAAEIDKPWTPKTGGDKLGFILSRIGLRQ